MAEVMTYESLVRDVVASEAPEELEHLGDVADMYVRNPASVDVGPGHGDEAAGFGAGELVVVLTPLLYAVLNDLAAGAAKEGALSVWGRLRARRARRRAAVPAAHPSERVAVYSPEEILWAQADLTQRLVAHGRPAREAAAAADRLGSLLGDL
ncbi:hypothetical protein ABZ924_29885 [Streptomyces sp. NPDC046876]|uniref:hypothetical protein n=1 Tax=Streptomyces sp. NPDC046876 TaxID=3155616 RepID=UPI0033EC9EB3